MFAYPWDLADRAPAEVMSELAGLGVDRLALAVTYHSAETIAPRRRSRVHTLPEANVAHLPLPDGAFADLRPPAGTLAREDPGLFPRLAAAAGARSIRLTAWTVTLHNSRLAAARPDTALRNCFGDPSGHGLCPANPVVRRYVRDVCAAVRGHGLFDELMLESLAYLPVGHGHPHELRGVRLDPATRLLLSLCFCPSCLAEGRRRGIDGHALASWVAAELHRTWNSPLTLTRRPDDGAELSALLLAREDLHAWVRMRLDVVTAVFAECVGDAAADGTAIAAGAAVWAKPAPLGWMEGIDLPALARTCARITLMPYYADLADVTRDLDHALAFAPPDRLQVLQTLWPRHHGDGAALLTKVRHTLSTGIDQIGLYNLTLAPEPALTWVRQVADLVHGR